MRDPSNPNLDPLIAPSIELVSAAIHTRFVAEGKPGADLPVVRQLPELVERRHAEHGLLPQPDRHPVGDHRQPDADRDRVRAAEPRRRRNDNPFPVAAADVALPPDDRVPRSPPTGPSSTSPPSTGRTSCSTSIGWGRTRSSKGSRDNWTMSADGGSAERRGRDGDATRCSGRAGAAYPAKYYAALRDPASRDARGYILPSDQPDFLTATKFVNALIKNGVTVHRATRPFQVAGRGYPAGSYRRARPRRRSGRTSLDCFEPQDYPDDFAYPGGPPVRPYDVTGYTLAYQMGVQFDRVLDAFDGPFEKIEGLATAAGGQGDRDGGGAGYLLSHEVNDAFVADQPAAGERRGGVLAEEPLGRGRQDAIPPGRSTSPRRRRPPPLLQQAGRRSSD